MPGPMRGRTLRGGLSGGGLVHLRRPRRHRRDHRGAPQGGPRGLAPAHMSRAGERFFIAGGAGRIETVLDRPEGAPRGVALVAHPHPLYGGTLDNKVVQTLARTFVELGYAALRPNFRGVGASEGVHDEGRGETEDLLRVAAHGREVVGDLPLVLVGFSFGAAVQTQVAQRTRPLRVVLVGVAVGRFPSEAVPADSIVIHGELDET